MRVLALRGYCCFNLKKPLSSKCQRPSSDRRRGSDLKKGGGWDGQRRLEITGRRASAPTTACSNLFARPTISRIIKSPRPRGPLRRDSMSPIAFPLTQCCQAPENAPDAACGTIRSQDASRSARHPGLRVGRWKGGSKMSKEVRFRTPRDNPGRSRGKGRRRKLLCEKAGAA